MANPRDAQIAQQAKNIQDMQSHISVLQTKGQVSTQVCAELINANIELRTGVQLAGAEINDLKAKLAAATNTITQLSAKLAPPPATQAAAVEVANEPAAAAEATPAAAAEATPAA